MENKVIENLKVTAYANEGKSIAHHEGKVVFIKGAVPGDVVNVSVIKNKKDWIDAEVLEVVEASRDRQEPFCMHFGTCGGCQWQHMKYEVQLKYKESSAADTLERIGKISIAEKLPVVGSEMDRCYRNKLEFTFSDREWLPEKLFRKNNDQPPSPALGYHLPGAFDRVFDVKTCHLQPPVSDRIRLAIKEFTIKKEYEYFNLRKQSGLMRNVIIRIATTGQIMVLVVFAKDDRSKIQALMDFLQLEFPEITSLQYVINNKRNDTIYDLPVITASGSDFIYESIGNLQFRISAKSFFQTNTRQAEKLYECVKEFAQLKGNELVYDLYSGTGSIALYISGKCRQVFGIEEVEQAVQDARANASLNKIENAIFFSSEVSKMINSSFYTEHGKPDIVITDPPRAGMHEKVVTELMKMAPSKIIYVSCNVSTQARDLQLLSAKYRIDRSRTFDLFPQTHHVENVAELNVMI